eukprot:gnl/TRDRNA2_/TRDRNA2_75553_c0_seq1.p1 gnl/TRDRNA2_/TRDRNA2_75553_c0~~gnl/TRDRNA2_/TRDRNA2_75553_c0_seq1.p1  ORF type:complete len:294 (+),score=6.35 gnl/TRDRNA2_/TRDRNA2_75553_c0_seq1:15-896(+)
MIGHFAIIMLFTAAPIWSLPLIDSTQNGTQVSHLRKHASNEHDSAATPKNDDSAATCLGEYAGRLDAIQMGLGKEILKAVADLGEQSKFIDTTPIIINLGFGHTGTRFVSDLLLRLGVSSQHWRGYRANGRLGGKSENDAHLNFTLKTIGFNNSNTWEEKRRQLCYRTLRDNDLKYPFKVDAIADDPTGQLFWHWYRVYPNARFLLTTRDPEEWVDRRTQIDRDEGHWDLAPLLFSCGRTMNSFSRKELVNLYKAYTEVVQCVVPDILTLNIVDHNSSSDEILSLIRDFVREI